MKYGLQHATDYPNQTANVAELEATHRLKELVEMELIKADYNPDLLVFVHAKQLDETHVISGWYCEGFWMGKSLERIYIDFEKLNRIRANL